VYECDSVLARAFDNSGNGGDVRCPALGATHGGFGVVDERVCSGIDDSVVICPIDVFKALDISQIQSRTINKVSPRHDRPQRSTELSARAEH